MTSARDPHSARSVPGAPTILIVSQVVVDEIWHLGQPLVMDGWARSTHRETVLGGMFTHAARQLDELGTPWVGAACAGPGARELLPGTWMTRTALHHSLEDQVVCVWDDGTNRAITGVQHDRAWAEWQPPVTPISELLRGVTAVLLDGHCLHWDAFANWGPLLITAARERGIPVIVEDPGDRLRTEVDVISGHRAELVASRDLARYCVIHDGPYPVLVCDRVRRSTPVTVRFETVPTHCAVGLGDRFAARLAAALGAVGSPLTGSTVVQAVVASAGIPLPDDRAIQSAPPPRVARTQPGCTAEHRQPQGVARSLVAGI